MAEGRISLLSAPRDAQGRGCRAPHSRAATRARKRGHNRHFLAVKRCFLQDLGSLLLFCARPYRVSRACRRVLGEKREAGVQGETQEQPQTPEASRLFASKHRHWAFGTAGQGLRHISGYESLWRQVLLGPWFWGSSGRKATWRESRKFGRDNLADTVLVTGQELSPFLSALHQKQVLLSFPCQLGTKSSNTQILHPVIRNSP